MTHLLDSSAVLAHYFNEPGHQRVQDLIDDKDLQLGISVLTLFEIAIAVTRESGNAAIGESASSNYARVFTEIIPATREIIAEAIRLRTAATARIALADSVIAATAISENAILVHRDPHFNSLPPSRPAKESLPLKS